MNYNYFNHRPIVRHIDRTAVAQAMTDKHNAPQPAWRNVLAWLLLVGSVVAFWWWAYFC